MLPLRASLLALTLCLTVPGSAWAHGDERSERGDRGDRSERSDKADRDRTKAAERAERDRTREAERQREEQERASLDAAKAMDDMEVAELDERPGSSESGSSGGSGSLGSSGSSGSSGSDDADGDIQDDDNSGSGSSNDSDDHDDHSGSSGSDSDDDDGEGADDDHSGSSGSGSSDNDEEDDDDSDDDDSGERKTGLASLGYDNGGHAYRDREVLVLLSVKDSIERLSAAGFSVIEKRTMRRSGDMLVRAGYAGDMKASEALEKVKALYPDAEIDFSHLYSASAGPDSHLDAGPLNYIPESRSVPINIAVVDGFSGDPLPAGIELKSFVDHAAGIQHGEQVLSVLLSDLSAYGSGHPDRLLVADVAEQFREAGPQASVFNLIDALDWVASEGANIINISLTGPPNKVLATIVDDLEDSGVLMIASVGNSGPATSPGYPAAYSSVVGVTAVTSDGMPYLYAARGDAVELSARGVGLRLLGESDFLSGTSFAAPRVTALAAKLMDDGEMADQRAALRSMAKDLGAPGRDAVFGYGVIPSPEQLNTPLQAAGFKNSFQLRE